MHRCHWPQCEIQVPPAAWGCKKHWFALPLRIRNRIWKSYTPSQEITGSPNGEYMAAAKEAYEWAVTTIKIFQSPNSPQ